MVILTPIEKKTLEVLQFAVGTENAITTTELTQKVYAGKDILCHSGNRLNRREICSDYENRVRTTIHSLRNKLRLFIFSMSFQADAIDINPNSVTYKEKIIITKRAYFIPLGKDLDETLKLIKNASDRLQKNIVGNRKTLRLLQELKERAKSSNLSDIIFEQQERIKKALSVNVE
jgi:hypothetical protein